MTIAELERVINSKKRVEKQRLEEKAMFDYIHADLVGKSVARIYHSNNKMPSIAEAYPSIFDKEDIETQKAQKQAELSALRFKMFAKAHNDKFKSGGGTDK